MRRQRAGVDPAPEFARQGGPQQGVAALGVLDRHALVQDHRTGLGRAPGVRQVAVEIGKQVGLFGEKEHQPPFPPGPLRQSGQHPALADAGFIGLDEAPALMQGVQGQRQRIDLLGREGRFQVGAVAPQGSRDEGVHRWPVPLFHSIQGAAAGQRHVGRNHGDRFADPAARLVADLIDHRLVLGWIGVQRVGRGRLRGVGRGGFVRRGVGGRRHRGQPFPPAGAEARARGASRPPQLVPGGDDRHGIGHRGEARPLGADHHQPHRIVRAVLAVQIAVHADHRLDLEVVGQEIEEVATAAVGSFQGMVARVLGREDEHRAASGVALAQAVQQQRVVEPLGRERSAGHRHGRAELIAHRLQAAERRIGDHVVIGRFGRAQQCEGVARQHPHRRQRPTQAVGPPRVEFDGGDGHVLGQSAHQSAVPRRGLQHRAPGADRAEQGLGRQRQRQRGRILGQLHGPFAPVTLPGQALGQRDRGPERGIGERPAGAQVRLHRLKRRGDGPHRRHFEGFLELMQKPGGETVRIPGEGASELQIAAGRPNPAVRRSPRARPGRTARPADPGADHPRPTGRWRRFVRGCESRAGRTRAGCPGSLGAPRRPAAVPAGGPRETAPAPPLRPTCRPA